MGWLTPTILGELRLRQGYLLAHAADDDGDPVDEPALLVMVAKLWVLKLLPEVSSSS
jgi:hypothetical protein